MVLGLPCQFDYRNVAYAFQRTFGHLLPRGLQNQDLVEGPWDQPNYLPTSPGGYNTAANQVGRIQAREQDQLAAGKVSGADIYQNGLPSATSRKSSRGSQRSNTSMGVKKEVRWDGDVLGGEEGPEKRGSISRAV
ncbi:hypothetical protein DRE_02743 [Drechslerella stenobrocha 248]|uniref:Uncharacterized protein n=1 Tax=Drechslerella stenobrocha 248 TaxID=1043628 RepID=W7HUG9_9PEZI|nr:hypothetical protein DRE_02743 [Drechslerella stenobrocha 248]